ncbi:MAG: type VI secretion system baseplate subunit TssF [Pirellulaceae bacterium]|nr:type VI secretion system baseplate subunit TssF [Pirellulaceae bacterium]
MKDPLLDFYERELGFIREEGREFARRYPKIAGRLRLSDAENVEDPHVSRMIEAFALLCARLRIKMEDEFPEICHSLLQALYPQYLAPIPPIAICQLKLTDISLNVPSGRFHRRGQRMETEAVDGVQCEFRLCYDTQVLPLEIQSAEYLDHPLPFEVEPSWKNNVQAAIRVRLKSQSEKLPLHLMDFTHLRLYLGGSTALGSELYEAFFRDAVGVTLYTPQNLRGNSVPGAAIRPVGFGDGEGLLEEDSRTIKAYQLLWEFFASPEKFRFVDIKLDDVWAKTTTGAEYVDLVILLRKTNPTVKRELRDDTLRLSCSPIINLFEHRAEPFRITGNKTEYRIIPSARKPHGMEVISVDRVSASSPGGEEQRKFKPFYLPSHHQQSQEEEMFWHSTRRRRLSEEAEGDRGTEVYLTLVDLHSQPQPLSEWTLHVTTTCCNRDLVSRLPFGGGRPRITLRDAGGAITVELLTPPSPTLRPVSPDEYYWRLISHLGLNHLTLADNKNGAQALREILALYNPSDSDSTKRAIQSVESVSYKRSVGRLSGEFGSGFCRGIDVDVVVDEERLVGMGPFLFATILDRFFSLFATVNSFTRLTVRSRSGSEPLFVGKARAGDRYLL